MPSLVLCLWAAGAPAACAQPQVLFCRCPFHRPPAAGAQLQVPFPHVPSCSPQLWFSSEAALALRCWHFGVGHRSQSRALHGLPVYIGAPVSSIFATAPWPAVSLPLRRPRPATNLIWQRSTPVWLAIWRTWTGFANSQLRCANFPALIYIYASIPIAATLEPLLRQTQICRPICTDCLRHLRISAE